MTEEEPKTAPMMAGPAITPRRPTPLSVQHTSRLRGKVRSLESQIHRLEASQDPDCQARLESARLVRQRMILTCESICEELEAKTRELQEFRTTHSR